MSEYKQPIPTTDGAIERLPKWAQHHIERLTRYARDCQAKVDDMNGTDWCNTVARDYARGDRRLGHNALIQFRMTTDDDRDYIEARMTGPTEVEVRSSSRLSIEPRSGNVFVITWRDR